LNSTPKGKRKRIAIEIMKGAYMPARLYIKWVSPFIVLYSIHFLSTTASPFIPISGWLIAWIPILLYDYRYTEKVMKRKGLI